MVWDSEIEIGGWPTLVFLKSNPLCHHGCPTLALFLAQGWVRTNPNPLLLVYNSLAMPKRLVRYQQCGVFHFLTFSCYRRLPLLARAGGYGVFEVEFEAVRRRYGFVVAGYVLMPEHVHLLVGKPPISTLSVAIQVLKQQTSRKLKPRGEVQFWQRRYYDFNVWTEEKQIEKLRYMHRNPVKRGLVERPEEWPWSTFRHYATGEIGAVEIESEWTARRRELERKTASELLCIPPLR